MGSEFDPWSWYWSRSLATKWLVASAGMAALIAVTVTVRAHSNLHLYVDAGGQVMYRDGNLWRPLGPMVWIEAFTAYFVSNFLAWGLILGVAIWLYKMTTARTE